MAEDPIRKAALAARDHFPPEWAIADMVGTNDPAKGIDAMKILPRSARVAAGLHPYMNLVNADCNS